MLHSLQYLVAAHSIRSFDDVFEAVALAADDDVVAGQILCV